MARTKPPAATPATTVDVRLLQDCAHGRCGDLVQLPAHLLPSAVADGLADDHPDAVAYARAQQDPS